MLATNFSDIYNFFQYDEGLHSYSSFFSNAINYKIYCKQKQFLNRPLMIGKMIFECYLSGGYRESIFFIWNNLLVLLQVYSC